MTGKAWILYTQAEKLLAQMGILPERTAGNVPSGKIMSVFSQSALIVLSICINRRKQH